MKHEVAAKTQYPAVVPAWSMDHKPFKAHGVLQVQAALDSKKEHGCRTIFLPVFLLSLV